MRKLIIYAIVIAWVAMMIAGCSEKKEETNLAMEIAAKQLGKKAEALEKAGRHSEADEIYKELKTKYGETKYYGEISASLEKSGISIEDSLSSKTSKEMFMLQNLIIEVKRTKGEYPEGHAINIPKDIWGNRLVYKITPESDKYEFYVMSLGPDQRDGTDDDLYLIHKGEKGEKPKKPDEKEAEKVDRRRWASGDASDAELEEGIKQSGGFMKMDDFTKMADKVSASSGRDEKKMSLKELESEAGSKREKRRGGGEKVISLEELLQQQGQ